MCARCKTKGRLKRQNLLVLFLNFAVYVFQKSPPPIPPTWQSPIYFHSHNPIPTQAPNPSTPTWHFPNLLLLPQPNPIPLQAPNPNYINKVRSFPSNLIFPIPSHCSCFGQVYTSQAVHNNLTFGKISNHDHNKIWAENIFHFIYIKFKWTQMHK